MGNSLYLSRRNTTGLKGFFAICILFHHIFQSTNILQIQYVDLFTRSRLGIYSVSVFFFLSGYGLLYSFLEKGREYIKTFPRKRILPFFIIIVIFTALFAFLYLFFSNKKEVSVGLLLQSLLWGKTIISHGWYFQVQLMLYIFFYLSALCFKNSKKTVTVMCLSIIIYYLLCVFYKKDVYWYVTTPCFTLGLLFCFYKEKLDSVISKKKVLLILLSLFVMLLSLLSSIYMDKTEYMLVSSLFKTLEPFSFLTLMLSFLSTSKAEKFLSCNFMLYLGRISLSIYALHGFFMDLFRGTAVYIENDWIFALAVIAFSIIGAVISTPLIEKIYSLCRN